MFLGEALIRIKGFIINKRGIKEMRKIGTIFVIGLLLVGFAFAGGIVHNTNNSADFIRLMNRNASTDVDAVYFNPAGLTYLNDGLHFYLSSQTIYQTRTITSDVPSLTSDTFEGTTFAPVFPNFYVAYKKGDLAFGAGLVPIGGGGSAIFDDGLPSFAVPASLLPSGLTAFGIPTSNYDFDIAFDGSSIYLGGQAVVSYKINDMISVAGGARYFAATNSYTGHLKDIMIDPNYPDFGYTGNMVSAPEFFNTMAGALTAGAAQALGGAAAAQGGADALQPFIDGGAGDLPFATLIALGMVDQATVDGIGAGVAALGGTFNAGTDTPAGTQAFFSGTAAYLTGYSAELTANAGAMAYNAAATQDIEVETEQTGSGFAPIFGLYLTPMEGLSIGLRYEAKATMTLTNETVVDGSGMFPDGAEVGADMPAMFSVGLALKAAPSLRFVADMNYYFNQGVDWDGKEDYLKDGMEAGFGLDFAVNESLQLSAGFLRTLSSGALPRYHTDLSYSLTSSTVGAGGRYNINPNLYVSFGASTTIYDDLYNSGVDYRGMTLGNETYDKMTVDFAIGIGYSR
jgi:long-chain fatty acid transport protein